MRRGNQDGQGRLKVNSPLRSLTIVHVLGSYGIGGAEQVALELASRQRRAGHIVHVVALSRGALEPNAARFHAERVGVHQLAKLGPTVDPTLPLRLAVHLRWLGADIVHSHNPMPLIYCAPAAKLARVPHVYTKHGANKTAGANRLRQLTSRLVDKFVAVSEQTARDAVEQGEMTREGLAVIENGIDLSASGRNDEDRGTIRRELGIEDSALVIGTVGRLSAIKNQPLLVRACAPLLNSQVQLVLVGEGPHRPAVEAAIRDSGVSPFIHLLGQRMDVRRILSSLDVFALTSDNEGLPLAIPEAMAAGLPVVSTAVGGIPDVVRDGETGKLVPAGDETALRSALDVLIHDHALRHEYGTRGRELAVTRYSARAMYDSYMDIYGTLLNR